MSKHLIPASKLLTGALKYPLDSQLQRYNKSLDGKTVCVVVSVLDRLLNRKNRKLRGRMRKFRVSSGGSPVNSFLPFL